MHRNEPLSSMFKDIDTAQMLENFIADHLEGEYDSDAFGYQLLVDETKVIFFTIQFLFMLYTTAAMYVLELDFA